jgi:iron-sulfur cluster assembly protein
MSATSIASKFTLSITGAAADEIRRFVEGEAGLPQSAGLRLRVVPGGCSGFQYGMAVEEGARPGDRVLVGAPGVRLFVDAFSAQYLNGVEIDYVTNLTGSGFTFKNPNATGGCGCGSSFTA